MTAPQRFEDRLLHELRQVVAERPAPAATPARRPRRARLALAGAGVATATAALAIVAATGNVTTDAYAVQSGADGAVTVSIRSLSDAAGLERSLRAAGVPAVVDYVPAGQAGCVGSLPAGGPESGTPEVTRPAPATGAVGQVTSGGPQGPSLDTSAVGQGFVTSGPDPGPGAPGTITSRVLKGEDGVTFTIGAGAVKAGEKLYITTSTGAVSTIGMAVGTSEPGQGCGTK